MAQGRTNEFTCPQCRTRYKVVRVPKPPDLADRPISCKVCTQPLAATDGDDILKYFLVSKARAPEPA
jgi:hypothetical protein